MAEYRDHSNEEKNTDTVTIPRDHYENLIETATRFRIYSEIQVASIQESTYTSSIRDEDRVLGEHIVNAKRMRNEEIKKAKEQGNTHE